jgi:hypothetical protein
VEIRALTADELDRHLDDLAAVLFDCVDGGAVGRLHGAVLARRCA